MNGALRNYYRRLDDGDDIVVFVAALGPAVVGFVAFTDLRSSREAASQVAPPFLLLSGLGVDESSTRKNVATRLLKKVHEIAKKRIAARRPYTGVAAYSLDDYIEELLIRGKFEPLEGIMWWRPL